MALTNAKTPEDPAALATLLALQGKTESAKDNVITLGGGQEWDAAAGMMRNVPQRAIDLRTGREIGGLPAGQKQAATGPAAPTSAAEYNALPKGAQYVKNGVTYTKG